METNPRRSLPPLTVFSRSAAFTQLHLLRPMHSGCPALDCGARQLASPVNGVHTPGATPGGDLGHSGMSNCTSTYPTLLAPPPLYHHLVPRLTATLGQTWGAYMGTNSSRACCSVVWCVSCGCVAGTTSKSIGACRMGRATRHERSGAGWQKTGARLKVFGALWLAVLSVREQSEEQGMEKTRRGLQEQARG